MQPGESFVREDEEITGAHGKTVLVVTTKAFYLKVAGRFVRHPYSEVKGLTVDTHDVFVAMVGKVVRFSARSGTSRSQAIQSLKAQMAMNRTSAA